MAKDPAFLMYSKDWLEGTAEMMPEEKGVYIDLLCHQHQKGSIPKDEERLARMVALSVDDFKKIWAHISHKFTESDGRLINKKMDGETNRREDRAKKNRINGSFASVLRTKKLSSTQYKAVKADFKFEQFLPLATIGGTKELTNCITKWYEEWSKSIATATVTATNLSNTEGVKGEISEEQKRLNIFMSEKFPELLNFAEPITYNQFKKLQEEYPNHEIEQVLSALSNKLGAAKKYVSVYKTALIWLKRNRQPKI